MTGSVLCHGNVFSSIRTTPEKFENASLFLRFGLPSTSITLIIRHEKRKLSKVLFKQKELETADLSLAFRCQVNENDKLAIIMWFYWPSFPQTKNQNDGSRPVYTGDLCRGNSMQFLSRQSCNLKIACVNQVQFLVRFVAAISQGFRACLKLDAILLRQKLHRNCRDKNHLCKRAFRKSFS